MQCEVCGRTILGTPQRVIIERARMVVCSECANLGSDRWEPNPETYNFARKGTVMIPRRPPTAKRFEEIDKSETLRVVEDFGRIIRVGRQRSDLTLEELGRRIGEKTSLLRRIESNKMIPDDKVVAKLERFFKVSLMAPIVDSNRVSSNPRADIGLTLGEVATIKKPNRRQNKSESNNRQSQK